MEDWRRIGRILEDWMRRRIGEGLEKDCNGDRFAMEEEVWRKIGGRVKKD